MPRRKLGYEERVLIEDLQRDGASRAEICMNLGITSYELQQEYNLGWIKSEKRYSAEKAQFNLK